MGLKSIADDGTFTYHCDAPNCQYHNCADPISDPGQELKDYPACVHHDHLPQEDRPLGTARSISIEDEDIQWSDCGTMVALPPCDCPGKRQLFVKVIFTEEELANAMIDEVEEYVEKVVDKDFELIRTSLKQQLKIDVPQKVKLVKNYRVVGRHQHPMVARHQALGEQLKAIGKHPPHTESIEENEVTHE